MRKTTTITGALAAMILLLAGARSLWSADHLDAPGLTSPGGDPALDITDLYTFASPDCDDCTVLIMAVNGLSGAGVNAARHPAAQGVCRRGRNEGHGRRIFDGRDVRGPTSS